MLEREADILSAINATNKLRRVIIHSVSIGRSSWLLRRLAQANGGEYSER